jgi:head-tail adaptor
MDAGQLNTRITVKRNSKTADGFGGWTSGEITIGSFWAEIKELDGEVKQENGIRQRYVDIEITMRKRSADNLQNNDLIEVEGSTVQYRLNNRFSADLDYMTTLKATKVD